MFCIFLMLLLFNAPFFPHHSLPNILCCALRVSVCHSTHLQSPWSYFSPAACRVTVQEVLSPSPEGWVLRCLEEFRGSTLLPLLSISLPFSLTLNLSWFRFPAMLHCGQTEEIPAYFPKKRLWEYSWEIWVLFLLKDLLRGSGKLIYSWT